MKSARTRLSSKGQVVIPIAFRRTLHLSPGEELQVELDPSGAPIIMLRRNRQEDMEHLLERGYRWIEKTGVDLVRNLHDARRLERTRERRRRS